MNGKVLLTAMTIALASAASALQSITPSVPEVQWTKSWWLPRFDAKRAQAASGGCEVAFLGDSITHFWEDKGKDVWAANFAEGPYKAVNFGFSGDRTEHLLWRLDHGQMDGMTPKAIVLMIGTNNTGHRKAHEESPTDTALGVQSVLERLGKLFPEAKVILHPIFPRGAATNDALRVRNDLVNSVIRQLADGKRVLWCDFNARLLTADGTLERSMAPDLLHPGAQGYAIWAEELKPYLDYALGRTAKAPKPAKRAAPTALVRDGPKTVIPTIKMHWFANRDPKVQARIRDKRIEETANADRYYDAIWIGDSITHFWENRGKTEVFKEKFGQYRILNLGFGGDRTENLLWNVRYGGFLDGVHTRLVTLMIGTNNTWSDSAEDIAAGIRACVKEIRAKQPQAKLLLFTVLPREVAHKRGERNFRRKAQNVDEIMPKQTRVNELIRPLADGKDVILVDLCPKFTDAEGLPDITLLGDGTHPNAAGYRVWADAVLPLYRRILGGVSPDAGDEEGFAPLFNGKDLSGWEGATDTYCVSPEGYLTCTQRDGKGESGAKNLWTAKDYANFTIRFDVKLPPNANNGLGIRCPPNGWCSREGMELQLLDDWGDAYNGTNRLEAAQYTGAVYGVVPPIRKPNGESYLNRPGEWNTVEVTANGPRIVFVLNGTKIVDADVSKFSTDGTVPPDGIKRPGLHNRTGRIHWCGHGHNIFWRNIRIKELP